MKPETILKNIVKVIRESDELQGVACKYADSRSFASNPVSCFTLCLGVGKIKFERHTESSSPDFFTELDLCLLAPSGAGGKRLSEVALRIGESIRENISVSSLEIGEARFNEVSSILFCDIKVTVEDTSLSDTVCRFLVSGVDIEDIISFEIESNGETAKRAQLLNGYIYEETGYVINLKTAGPLFRRGSGFTVQIDYESLREVYRNCKIQQVKRQLSDSSGLSFSYEITAESCELSEKEVQSE